MGSLTIVSRFRSVRSTALSARWRSATSVVDAEGLSSPLDKSLAWSLPGVGARLQNISILHSFSYMFVAIVFAYVCDFCLLVLAGFLGLCIREFKTVQCETS